MIKIDGIISGRYIVFNTMGQIVQQGVVGEYIDIQNLVCGKYTIRIIENNRINIGTFILQ